MRRPAIPHSLGRYTAFLFCIAFLTASTPSGIAQTWSLHGPASRNSHTAVWDSVTSQMIIFGGLETGTNADLNDVWLGKTSTNLDDSFTQLLPAGTLPAGRYGHVAAYDSKSNHMMIFGGALGLPIPCANDSWILSNANGNGGAALWTQLNPSGTLPTARIYSAGAYDATSNSLMIFGGYDCSSTYFNDVWVLRDANGEAKQSSQSWMQLTPAGTPPSARESASAVYDSVNNVLMVYGGDAGATPFGDVWILSHANGNGGTPTWTQLSPTGTAPMARTGHSGTYDSHNNRMTIFAGIYDGQTLADAWVLTFANGIGGTPAWSQIPTEGTAPSVAYFSGVYDSKLDNLYVFAGISSQGKLATNDHAFTLSGANGISTKGFRWFLGGPPVRYGHSAFYDPVTNGLFVFGGAHATTLLFNDYWEAADVIGSTNLDWVSIHTPGTLPSARYGQTGLYDSASNRLMIFGGATTKACLADYHVLENANTQGGTPTWLALTPSGTTPAARVYQSSAYIAASNQIIIFGGSGCKTTYYNDVWLLNNANNMSGTPSWTQLLPTGTAPSVREGASAIYDPTTNELIIYGGDKGSSPFNDIWVLSNANGTGGTPAWTQTTPSNNGPVARAGHTATYDVVDNIMTIYAGSGGSALLDDAWTLSNANGTGGPATWTQLPSSGQFRRYHTSEYDPVSGNMITFGGTTGLEPLDPSSDLYTLTYANGLP